MIRPETSLGDAAKCALISMDSTLRSNLSVGLPLDMLVYKTDSLEITHFSHIDAGNAYFNSVHQMWGEKLKEVFSALPNPVWAETSAEEARLVSLRVGNSMETRPTHSIQTLAGQQ